MEKANVSFELNVGLDTNEYTALFGIPEWKDVVTAGRHVQTVMGIDVDAPPFMRNVDLGKAALAVANSTELSDQEKTIVFIFGIRGLAMGDFSDEPEEKEKDEEDKDEE